MKKLIAFILDLIVIKRKICGKKQRQFALVRVKKN